MKHFYKRCGRGYFVLNLLKCIISRKITKQLPNIRHFASTLSLITDQSFIVGSLPVRHKTIYSVFRRTPHFLYSSSGFLHAYKMNHLHLLQILSNHPKNVANSVSSMMLIPIFPHFLRYSLNVSVKYLYLK